MGNGQQKTAKEELSQVRSRLQGELGNIPVSGRYHQLPRKIEDDYILHQDKELGMGYNGVVFVAESVVNREPVAVKPFKLWGLTKLQKKELRNEVELFLGMDHPHVARLKDVYESKDSLMMVMEHMEGGELFDRLQGLVTFPEREAAQTAWMMLLAVNYLHERAIVHRDIKLENFLYDTRDYKFLKLIDFGFSRFHRNATRKMQLCCGTTAYMAPEVLSGSYDKQCDMWSLGVVVFILLAGYMPFMGSDAQLEQRIQAGEVNYQEERWGKISAEAKGFVSSLLVVDPTQRITAAQALEHPWLQKRNEAHSDDHAHMDKDASEILRGMQQFGASSKFRKSCMVMMAWSLTNEQRSKVRDAFLEMDTHNTGIVRLTDFKTVLQANLSVTDEEARRVFDALDTSCHEEVHYSDFLAAMVGSRVQINDHMIESAFRRFDVDNSGLITLENLRSVLGGCYEGHEIEKLLAQVDTSGDSAISMEEFGAFLMQSASEDQMEAAMTVIDTETRKQREEQLARTEDASGPAQASASAPPEASPSKDENGAAANSSGQAQKSRGSKGCVIA